MSDICGSGQPPLLKPSIRFKLGYWGQTSLLLGLAALPLGGLWEVVLLPSFAQAQTVAQANSQATTVLLVNSSTGNDATADGTDRAPFRTISQALRVAQPNTVVLLAPGRYTAETGETFPLQLKPGVVLQGNPETRGEGIVIQGSGAFLSRSFARQNVTILGATQAALVGVTVSNPQPQGYGLWVESTSPVVTDNTFTGSSHDGISVVGNSSPLIRNNYFYQNGANGITIYGTSRPEVRENVFEQTGFAINVNQNAAPLLVGNRITRNRDGVVVQANARPILRNNSVEGNERDGLVAIARSQPDLGTGSEPGGNFFRNNGQYDVNAKATSEILPAAGNELLKTIGRLDTTQLARSVTPTSDLSSPPVTLAAIPAIPASSPKPTVPAMPPRISGQPPSTPASELIARTKTEADEISAAAFPVPGLASPPSSSVRSTAAANSELPITPISSAAFPVPAALTARSAAPQSQAQSTVSPASPVAYANPAVPLATAPVASRSSLPALPKVAVSGSVPARSNLPLSELRPVSGGSAVATVPSSSSIPAPTASSRLVQPGGGLRLPTRENPIPIAVPAPEVRAVVAVAPERRVIPGASNPIIKNPAMPRSPVAIGLLPVPGPNAPIGNVGSSPGIKVYGKSGGSRTSSLFATNRALATGLRYRVLVETMDDNQQAQLRSLVPEAFPVSFQGRTVMQAGAFGDREKADQLLQALSSQGFRASINPIQ